MRPPGRLPRLRTRASEGGFTLIEAVVVVALLLVLAGSAYEALAQRPAQVRSSAVAFAGLVAQARALAAVTGDAALDGASGASIGVVLRGDDYVATLYRYRPVLGADHAPTLEPTTPPLHSGTAIALGSTGNVAQPPFALFFSASGHASAQTGYTIGVSPLLAAEPACPLEAGIVLDFSDAHQTQSYRLDCELALLELDIAGAPVHAPEPLRLP